MTEHIELNLAMIGEGVSGKTSLAIRYSLSEFPDEYIPTVFDNFTKKVVINNISVDLIVWDSAYNSDYTRLRPLLYMNKQIILLCFGIDRRHTFEEIQKELYPEMKNYAEGAPYILVGLKSDLRGDLELSTTTNYVSFNEALEYANEIQAENYIECSALNGTNVNWLFEYATKVGLDYITKKKPQSKCVVC
ncbi:Guanine nucleotide-binding protein Rho [Entamoeba marina]